MPITACDLPHDRVLPFYGHLGIAVRTVLPTMAVNPARNPRHPYELPLAVGIKDPTRKVRSPRTRLRRAHEPYAARRMLPRSGPDQVSADQLLGVREAGARRTRASRVISNLQLTIQSPFDGYRRSPAVPPCLASDCQVPHVTPPRTHRAPCRNSFQQISGGIPMPIRRLTTGPFDS